MENILKKIITVFVFGMVTLSAHAECDAKKAARNTALDASVGVSGFCSPKKAAKNGIADNTKVDEKKENIDNKAGKVKDKSSSLTHTVGSIKDAATN